MNNPFYDKNARTRKILSGFLPHWHQDGKLQFVTIRLADSLPQSKIEDLLELKKQFLADNPQPWDNSKQKEYWNLIGHNEAKYLDKGYGACILRNHKVRKIVTETLKHMDGNQYRLIAYVIMPNHVHMLLQVIGKDNIDSVMQRIKSFTAHRINEELHTSGPVWMKEYFDRLVRSEEHFDKYLSYIISNTKDVRPEDCELYVSPEFEK